MTIRVYRVEVIYGGGYKLDTRDVLPEYYDHLSKSGWRHTERDAKYAMQHTLSMEHHLQMNAMWNAKES